MVERNEAWEKSRAADWDQMFERYKNDLTNSDASPVNHIVRVAQGRKALEAGRSLADINVPIYVAPDAELINIRQGRIDYYTGRSNEDLVNILNGTEAEVRARSASKVGGTSELEWMRVQIRAELESRGVQVQNLNLVDSKDAPKDPV